LNNFSFFIPSIDYLTDVAGLMDYLGQKITVGYTCLYCNKEFAAMKSVRHHMVGHLPLYSFLTL
jgi:pre-60S factor REI1